MPYWWSNNLKGEATSYTFLEGTGKYEEQSDEPFLSLSTKTRTHMILRRYVLLLAGIFALCILMFLDWEITVKPLNWNDLPLAYDGDYRHVELNSTLGFEKVYAINLKKRADKRAEAAILGALYGVDIEFAPGVVGTDIIKLDDPKDRRQNEIGAHRAHTDLWTKIIEDKTATALIFEDDFDWDEDFKYQLNRLQEPLATYLASESGSPLSIKKEDPWNSQEWDILWLSTCLEGVWKGKYANQFLTYHDPTLVGGNGTVVHRSGIWKFLTDLNVSYPMEESQAHLRSRVIQRSVVPMCTAGYVITRRGAMKLLYEVMHQEWKALDNRVADIGRSRKVKALSVVPPIFSQFRYSYDHRDSDIAPPAHDWTLPKLPGAQGKSLSIKNSAKASLQAKLALSK